MPETIIESVLTGKLSIDVLLKWLNNDSDEDTPEDCELFCCSRAEFVAYFLFYLRNQTDIILKPKGTLTQHQNTSEKLLSSQSKHNHSISEPTSELETDRNDSLTVKTDRQRSHESPNRERSYKKNTRRVKTRLFNNSSKEFSGTLSISSSRTDSDESRLSSGLDSIVVSSTPLKNGIKPSEFANLSTASPVAYVKTQERCDTPRNYYRNSRSQEKSTLNLGDYLANAQSSKIKKKRVTPKNVSQELECHDNKSLDISNSEMFPEIGSRKSSSLKSEKRRIKPMILDTTPQKSYSMNSFNSVSFQQPSPLALEENLAFKQQKLQPKESANSFDAERSILKEERQKLMEKFNVLNISQSKTTATPKIKIMRRDSVEKKPEYINVDVSKVIFKEKIDLLVEIYSMMLKNNLILSIGGEIYFLISILLSKQTQEEHNQTQSNMDDKIKDYLLKSIINSSYFAVKSLWNQRCVLEMIFDKNMLKILGENKRLRNFCPELAKFLLNSYGLKCEEVVKDERLSNSLNKYANGMVCFNIETDNVDNFPSVLSFQNFRKQRDMFYDILRWYNENDKNRTSKSTFRGRVKTLLSLAITPANHAHLARLYLSQMTSECLPTSQQESKLSKLQRRFTSPNTLDSHKLPTFTNEEMFYKEFLMFAENECFRRHLSDSFTSEICILNSRTIVNTEDRSNSSPTDLSKEYVQISKKLGLLSKFLGYLTDLPYSQPSIDYSLKIGALGGGQKHLTHTVAKEKVMDSELNMRFYTQPTIDLKCILTDSIQKGHLCVTLPWLAQFLSMLNNTTLRTNYYQELLRKIFEIYIQKLRVQENTKSVQKNTKIYLKLTLGWLFELPQFPQFLFYDFLPKFKMADSSVAIEENIDSILVIDESIIIDLCPFLKDFNVLLTSSKVVRDDKEGCSFRHITPVSLSVNPEDRMRNKEKEIQARLEEALVLSLPTSSRRLVASVSERVAAAMARHAASLLDAARKRGVAQLTTNGRTQEELQLILKSIYENQLQDLRREAIQQTNSMIVQRIDSALTALLPNSAQSQKAQLVSLAVKWSKRDVLKWINEHWSSIDILCKDINAEVKNLIVLGDSYVLNNDNNKSPVNLTNLLLTDNDFETSNVSPSSVIIELKEQVCLLLDEEQSPIDIATTLNSCQGACVKSNVFMTTTTQGAIFRLTCDLAVVLASRKPKQLTNEFLSKLDKIWDTCCPDRPKFFPEDPDLERRLDLSPDLRNYTDDRMPTPITDDETESNVKISETNVKITETNIKIPETNIKTSETSVKTPGCKNKNTVDTAKDSDTLLDYFNRILCPRNIVLLSHTKCMAKDVWEAMASLLVFLINYHYLSEDSLTEQCLAVYRQDWPQATLESLSTCMRSVSSRRASPTSGKFNLFLDFLAEYCGDMEFESFQQD